MKIYLAGDSGLLGQALVQQFCSDTRHQVKGVSTSPFRPTPHWKTLKGQYEHEALNLVGSEKEVEASIKKFSPDIVVNCVALVNHSLCESDIPLAERLNAWLPGVMALTAKETGSRFVQISTDGVFDGRQSRPYKETDKTNPINQYGKSKLEGEITAVSNYPKTLVVRTNIVGFKDKKGSPTFGEWITSALWEQQPMTLFDDYVTSSIHVEDFSKLLEGALEKSLKGILHIASREGSSKYLFGQKLSDALGTNFSHVKKGSLSSSGLQPPRPPNLSLDVEKGEAALKQRFPTLEETVSKLARDFKSRLKEADHSTH